MFPVLLKLGPLTIRTYGFMVAIGFFVALQYVLHYSKKINIVEQEVLDIVLYTIVAGLVGGRLMYVALNWSFYSRNLLQIFQIWEGGLVFYGGFIAGALVIIFYYYRHPEFKIWAFADILAPAIALGHFFGRIGCLFAGCCYGLPTTLPWAIKFSNSQALAPLNVLLHPTQIYEAFGNLLVFFGLHWFNRYEHMQGQAFGTYLFLYGLLRFHVEILRGDDRGGYLLGLSPSQIFAIISIIASVTILFLINKKYEASKTNS
ncbi:MAG: prolipoprotein diacylglyceryl transferase [Endomicrobiales bacterium]|nr:prolipoprotein diacylglyceryl transferase [Endomicrobiales bacterium]